MEPELDRKQHSTIIFIYFVLLLWHRAAAAALYVHVQLVRTSTGLQYCPTVEVRGTTRTSALDAGSHFNVFLTSVAN